MIIEMFKCLEVVWELSSKHFFPFKNKISGELFMVIVLKVVLSFFCFRKMNLLFISRVSIMFL